VVTPPFVTSLMRPGAYPPEAAGPVTLLQTHISYILLTPRFAYKIKKPVNFGFLDFTTLEKRRRICDEEVRLNRRLAPDVYLGVVKITQDAGEFFMEGEGEAIEYAVKMRRLPEDRMLDRRLAAGEVTEADIVSIARAIAAFHAGADTGDHISGFGSPEVVGRNASENFSQTGRFVGKTISAPLYERIKAYSDGFMKENEGLFIERVEKGFIRDCHGDIHSEHIATGHGEHGVEIIDCIEFNERFRFSDIASDAAFLSMDLDFRGRHDLARVFDDAYIKASGDAVAERLFDFYRCYRAYVRGKVESFKSTEAEVKEEERVAAEISARIHFHLSGLYAAGGYRPMMVVVRGLSGTGKSTVAAALAKETGFAVLSSDRVRKELAGMEPEAGAGMGYGEGIYTPAFTERTYAELLRRGGALLSSGRPIILDATFSKVAYIEKAAEAAEGAGAMFRLVECFCADRVARERLEKRRVPGAPPQVSDADLEIYLKQKQSFEVWDGPGVRLDTALAMPKLMREVVRQVFD